MVVSPTLGSAGPPSGCRKSRPKPLWKKRSSLTAALRTCHQPAHLNGDLEVLNFERAKPNSLKAG